MLSGNRTILLTALVIVTLSAIGYYFVFCVWMPVAGDTVPTSIAVDSLWHPPTEIPAGDTAQIQYGRDLVARTAYYLGPKGIVAHISNGMNCQNCHLDAGTKPYGNNYSLVASTYPKYRARSGTVESIYKRINDCMERSLNGSKLDTTSREIQAMKEYIRWVGSNVIRGQQVAGAGIPPLPYMDRAADTAAGRAVYATTCLRCHGAGGQGLLAAGDTGYIYPPLWGSHSYNIGAGLYRLSRLAGYVYANMPHPTRYDRPVLSVAEAWDVAAYINSQPRPYLNLSHDWQQLSTKPIDHPFAPYTDTFTAQQHKYGPWQEIEKFYADKTMK